MNAYKVITQRTLERKVEEFREQTLTVLESLSKEHLFAPFKVYWIQLVKECEITFCKRLKVCAGKAMPFLNQVRLSLSIFRRTGRFNELRFTVIHEIAHCLRRAKGHDEAWQVIDLVLGGTGKRCHSMNCSKRRRSKTEKKIDKLAALKKQIEELKME